ncbi:MAG TPA: alginate export family protein [Bacteroidales bacterium]|nr:alginate export family protein [Bacteroidales bacterium]
MRKFYAFMGIGLTSLCCLSKVNGQSTIDAEFRPRTEYRQGFRKPLADTLNAGFVTLQRTRLNADYKGKILNARLSLQDARIWGNSDNKTNASKIELYEAWFEYFITSGFSAQMGRQPLKYDDQRLLSAPNWSNTGLAHDALVLKYNSPFIQVHSGFAYNNTKDTLMNVAYKYTPKQNYKTMGYAWLSKQIYTGTTLSLIGICEGFENKVDYNVVYPRITYGGNLVYANDSTAWGATLTGYMQQGKDPNKAVGDGYADLKSFFLAAKFSYKIIQKLSANVGVDYYSGSDAAIDAEKSNTFNRLYGATHSFNGNMEYFVTLPTQGLIDYYGGVTAIITPKLSADLSGHLFYFDKDFIYKNEKTDKNLGTELDVVLNYSVSKEIAIQGGYSHYFNSGTTMKYYKMQGVEAHPQQWAYVMLTIKPQFYKTPQN